jgi:hypothetical protein
MTASSYIETAALRQALRERSFWRWVAVLANPRPYSHCAHLRVI